MTEVKACLGESEFVLVDLLVDFPTAIEECEARGGTLAVPFDLNEHGVIAQLASILPETLNVWIGKPLTVS